MSFWGTLVFPPERVGAVPSIPSRGSGVGPLFPTDVTVITHYTTDMDKMKRLTVQRADVSEEWV